MNKTVLVTGGAGFIGSHIVEGYLKKALDVVIVDNLVSGYISNIEHLLSNDRVTFYKSDIRDKEALKNIFHKHNISIINHHAAQKSVPYSVDEPFYDLDNNIIGLLNLIEMTKINKIQNFIYISSGGALSKEIIDKNISKETDYPQLMSPYAITKFAGENYLKIYSKIYDFGYTILRYGNVYGPRQVAEGECGVIPIFVNNILEKKDSLLTTYEDMPRGCTRDYIYISDVVDINMIVSEKICNDTFNISSGREEYILDIYNVIQEVFQSSQRIIKKPPRVGDVKRSVLDISYVKDVLGWSPKVSLIDGIKLLKDYI